MQQPATVMNDKIPPLCFSTSHFGHRFITHQNMRLKNQGLILKSGGAVLWQNFWVKKYAHATTSHSNE